MRVCHALPDHSFLGLCRLKYARPESTTGQLESKSSANFKHDERVTVFQGFGDGGREIEIESHALFSFTQIPPWQRCLLGFKRVTNSSYPLNYPCYFKINSPANLNCSLLLILFCWPDIWGPVLTLNTVFANYSISFTHKGVFSTSKPNTTSHPYRWQINFRWTGALPPTTLPSWRCLPHQSTSSALYCECQFWVVDFPAGEEPVGAAFRLDNPGFHVMA